jgi:VWFA-related protein
MFRSMPYLCISAVSFLILTLAGSLAAQEEPVETSRVFEGATSVQLIEVPVRVLHKGDPVRGLTAESFEVYDNGVRQEITSFEIVDAQAEWVPETLPTGDVLPPPDRRNLFFLFDFAYGGLGNADAHRRLGESVEAVRKMVEEDLVPSDRVAIGFFSSLRGLKVIVDFTREREPVLLALHAIDLILDRKPRAVEEELSNWAVLAPDQEGRKAKTPLGPNQASLYDLVTEARVGSQRGDPFLQHDNVVKHLTWGIREFTERHAELGGMNYLVLVSRGVLYGDTQNRILFLLQEMFRDLRQENWSIQAINTAGLGFGRDTLLLMANETGGRLFTNTRDFNMLMGEVAETTAVTYLIAFQVYDLPEDGAYHEIDVRLIDGPKKARITHRPGYYAPGVMEPKWQRSSSVPERID